MFHKLEFKNLPEDNPAIYCETCGIKNRFWDNDIWVYDDVVDTVRNEEGPAQKLFEKYMNIKNMSPEYYAYLPKPTQLKYYCQKCHTGKDSEEVLETPKRFKKPRVSKIPKTSQKINKTRISSGIQKA